MFNRKKGNSEPMGLTGKTMLDSALIHFKQVQEMIIPVFNQPHTLKAKMKSFTRIEREKVPKFKN